LSITAVLPAAGVGKRFGADSKKQFFNIQNRPLIYYTLKVLNDSYSFDEFVIGAGKDDFEFLESVLFDLEISDFRLVEGGAERHNTVFNCVSASDTDYVLVHDAVRPFINGKIVSDTVNAAKEAGAAICAVPVRETLKKVSDGMVFETVDRNEFVLSHTPQVFNRELLLKAFEKINSEGLIVTDEAQAMEIAGFKVAVTESTPDNIKVTYMEDIKIIEGLIAKYF